MSLNLMKAARNVRHKVAVALRRQGITISRKPTFTQFLQSRQVELVLDVGANIGQFAGEIRAEGYRGQILSLEPISTVFAQLEEASASDPAWNVRRTAAGSTSGTAVINVSRNSAFSSIRSSSDFGKGYHDGIATVSTEEVPVIRLDDLPEFQDEARLKRSFIKIDTQGFEEEVLKGADRVLAHCAGIQLELTTAPLYEDVWQMDAALRFLREHGLVMAQARPVVFLQDRVSAIEYDCVFRRAE